ncbi:MAG: PilT/PilU family type 4a pilus ATPase [Candidatus Binatia bacterium]
MEKAIVDLAETLRAAVAEQASDVILKDGRAPMFRIKGELTEWQASPPLSAGELDDMARTLMHDDAQRMRFATERHVDLAFDKPGLGRFRVHVFRQRGSVGVAFRVIPPEVRQIAQLNLPPVVARLADERRGLVLVTGPTGSGKTTTLAAMIEHINRTSARHIVTIEDPIEYVHHERRSIISQREIGEDVNDYPSALQAALRQNPDVIMVGEMRDLKTMETALTAAETGHLVMSTLHTSDAPETVTRLVSSFPEDRRDQIRIILATVLRAVVSQRLLPRSDIPGLVPAVEIMTGTLRIREYIEKQRVRDLAELIAQGQGYGMQTFDQSLLTLFRTGRVHYTDALAHCRNQADFEMQARGIEAGSSSRTTFEVRDAVPERRTQP